MNLFSSSVDERVAGGGDPGGKDGLTAVLPASPRPATAAFSRRATCIRARFGTMNAQRSTSNAQHSAGHSVESWKLSVGCWMFGS